MKGIMSQDDLRREQLREEAKILKGYADEAYMDYAYIEGNMRMSMPYLGVSKRLRALAEQLLEEAARDA